MTEETTSEESDERPSGHSPLSERVAKVNILVADNNQRVANLISDMLEKVGFKDVTIARDGYEAIAAIATKDIHLMIVDWALKPSPDVTLDEAFKETWQSHPPVNGCSLIECIRHHTASPSPFIPIVMMTPPAKSSILHAARDAGVNEILVKPLKAQTLFDRLVMVIERPRHFVTCTSYRGPCRRRQYQPWDQPERRKRNVQVVRFGSGGF